MALATSFPFATDSEPRPPAEIRAVAHLLSAGKGPSVLISDPATCNVLCLKYKSLIIPVSQMSTLHRP